MIAPFQCLTTQLFKDVGSSKYMKYKYDTGDFFLTVWVRSRRWACLVTWFSYYLITNVLYYVPLYGLLSAGIFIFPFFRGLFVPFEPLGFSDRLGSSFFFVSPFAVVSPTSSSSSPAPVSSCSCCSSSSSSISSGAVQSVSSPMKSLSVSYACSTSAASSKNEKKSLTLYILNFSEET